MPLAQLKGLSGYLDAEQKKQLIERVTDAILSVEGEGLRPVTWVVIDDVPEGQWGVGGETVSVDFLKELSMKR